VTFCDCTDLTELGPRLVLAARHSGPQLDATTGDIIRPSSFALAIHEGAHAVAALRLGIDVVSLTCNGDECITRVANWPAWSGLKEKLLFKLAGRVADKQALSRSVDDLLACIAQTRAGRKGGCDWCHAFQLLLQDEPTATDRRLIDRFFDHEIAACNLICEPSARDAIRRIARVFFAFGHLDASDIRHLYAMEGRA